jgi:hypothetical protein
MRPTSRAERFERSNKEAGPKGPAFLDAGARHWSLVIKRPDGALGLVAGRKFRLSVAEVPGRTGLVEQAESPII